MRIKHVKLLFIDYHITNNTKPYEPRFSEARFHRLLKALLDGYDRDVRPVVM